MLTEIRNRMAVVRIKVMKQRLIEAQERADQEREPMADAAQAVMGNPPFAGMRVMHMTSDQMHPALQAVVQNLVNGGDAPEADDNPAAPISPQLN